MWPFTPSKQEVERNIKHAAYLLLLNVVESINGRTRIEEPDFQEEGGDGTREIMCRHIPQATVKKVVGIMRWYVCYAPNDIRRKVERIIAREGFLSEKVQDTKNNTLVMAEVLLNCRQIIESDFAG